MAKGRTELLVGMIVLGIGLALVGFLGLWGYMASTAMPVHPSAEAVSSVAQSSSPPQWADAVARGRQIARSAPADQNLPGLSVAVGIDGDLVWAEGFGWADLDRRIGVTPETTFRIGTASVALTSVAVGLLIEDGRLDLDQPIQTYVPQFPVTPWPVTLRQLMAHVAGVRNDGGDEGPLLSRNCRRAADGIDAFADRPLLFEPGTQHRYSSYGWILVSAAIEAVTDEPLLTFMQRRVFEPLGLQHTVADSATNPIAGRATPYFPRFMADPNYGLDLMRPVDYSCYSGASMFLSTPSDLVRFAMVVARGGLLQPGTVQLLQTSQRLTSGQDTGYGLGWDLDTAELAGTAARTVGHDGTSLGGPLASLRMLPERGLAVGVISNSSYADTATIAVQIARAFTEESQGALPR
jgi:CubicO group peptidase (beta-lactamase class C family)